MRRFAAGLLLIAVLILPVFAQDAIPPMPDLKAFGQGEQQRLADCPKVTRVGYDSEETKSDRYYLYVAWYKDTLEKPPFLISHFDSKQAGALLAYWLDLNRDGKADEYGTGAQYRERYPADNICVYILPRVTD